MGSIWCGPQNGLIRPPSFEFQPATVKYHYFSKIERLISSERVVRSGWNFGYQLFLPDSINGVNFVENGWEKQFRVLAGHGQISLFLENWRPNIFWKGRRIGLKFWLPTFLTGLNKWCEFRRKRMRKKISSFSRPRSNITISQKLMWHKILWVTFDFGREKCFVKNSWCGYLPSK